MSDQKDDEYEDDLWGENDSIDKFVYPKQKITVNDLYFPHYPGACCTAINDIKW